MGEPFALKAGVPQGSFLSPTLFTIYTADIPHPSIDCCNIQYADDITQIIAYNRNARHLMANLGVREIIKVNDYERKWKIQTNNSKFTIIPMAVKKKEDFIINNNIIPYKNSGRTLGLKITSSGRKHHIDEITTTGNIAIQELQRFRNLSTKLKLHLVKVFIVPIILYSIIPLVTINNKNIQKLQSLHNKALRFV